VCRIERVYSFPYVYVLECVAQQSPAYLRKSSIRGHQAEASHRAAHMKGSCHIYEGVMWHIAPTLQRVAHMKEAWHTSHVCDMICVTWYLNIHTLAYIWCVLRYHVTHMKKTEHTSQGIMSHIWKIISHICTCHVTHMNVSCGTSEGVMAHIWRIHATHTEESCHTYGGITSHTWKSQVTQSRQLLRGGTCEGVMSRIWRSHVTRMKTSCHTYEGVMSHIWRSHGMHVKESCHSEQELLRGATYHGVMSHIWRQGLAGTLHRAIRPLFALQLLAVQRLDTHTVTCFLCQCILALVLVLKKKSPFLVLYFQTQTDADDWVDLKWYLMDGMMMMLPYRDMLSLGWCLSRWYLSRDQGGWVGRRSRAQHTYTLAHTAVHLHVAALRYAQCPILFS